MKTARKSMLLVLTTFVSIFTFSQVNFGLQSNTRAAFSSTLNSAAITKATITTTKVAKSAAEAATTKAVDVATNTTTRVKVSQPPVPMTNGEIKNEVKKAPDANVHVDASLGKVNPAGSSAGEVLLTSRSSSGANAKLNGSATIDRTDNTIPTTTASAENKISTTAETTKIIKAKTSSEPASTVTKAGDNAKITEVSASGEAKSASSVKVDKQ